MLTQGQRNRLRQIDLQRKGPGEFREPTVVKELNLTADQRRRINAIETETFAMPVRGGPGPLGEPGTGRTGGPGFDWWKISKRRRTAGERIQAVLTDPQKKWREMTGDPYKGPMQGFFPGPGRPFGPRRDS